jgi:tetratricopeptide (TPR) repeat protein
MTTPTPALQKSVLLHARAQELRQQGKLQAAAQAYQEAIQIFPGNSAPYHALAEMLFQFGDVAAAAKVIAAAPAAVYQQSWPLKALQANVKLRLGDAAGAREALAALMHAPGVDRSQLLFNLACCDSDLGDLEAAIEHYRQARQAGLDQPVLYINWGTACQKLGRMAEAGALFAEAVQKFPAHGDLRYEQGIYLLRNEDYAQGFRLLRHRWESSLIGVKKIMLPIPEWDGVSPVDRLLVVREQGIGDQLVYSALLPGLMQRAGTVTAALDPRLHALLQRTFPGLAVAPDDEAALQELATRHDAFLYIADAGAVSVENVGWKSGPLQPDPQRVAALRQHYREKFPGRKLVGLSWRSPKARLDAHKSIDIRHWQPVLAQPDCQFVSLQYGEAAADLATAKALFGVDIHSDEHIDVFNDIEGLAAQIAALDQVITVSNTTAHVAAALGTPTWVLLSRATGLFWYWGLRQEHTSWYPSARLFRAREEGRWDEVIAAVADALRGRA